NGRNARIISVHHVPVLAGYRTATISISGQPGSSDAWRPRLAVLVLIVRRRGRAAAVLQVEGGRDQDDWRRAPAAAVRQVEGGRDQDACRRERRPGVDGVAAGNRLVDRAQGVGQEPG